jgi:hypothetical protein
MKRLATAAAIGIWIAPGVWAQEHDHCAPAPSAAHREAVDHRHGEVTGVGHQDGQHHFVLTKDGGVIRLEVKDTADTAARDRIRGHLEGIARAFGAGDFTMPRRIHDQAPPGVDVMAARKSAIRYVYAPTEKGGEVTIWTRDAAARDAVHRFLRFQISDHGTGDKAE